MNKEGKWVKDGIHDFRRVILTYSYVLWTNQLSSNIPNNNEQDLIGFNQH